MGPSLDPDQAAVDRRIVLLYGHAPRGIAPLRPSPTVPPWPSATPNEPRRPATSSAPTTSVGWRAGRGRPFSGSGTARDRPDEARSMRSHGRDTIRLRAATKPRRCPTRKGEAHHAHLPALRFRDAEGTRWPLRLATGPRPGAIVRTAGTARTGRRRRPSDPRLRLLQTGQPVAGRHNLLHRQANVVGSTRASGATCSATTSASTTPARSVTITTPLQYASARSADGPT